MIWCIRFADRKAKRKKFDFFFFHKVKHAHIHTLTRTLTPQLHPPKTQRRYGSNYLILLHLSVVLFHFDAHSNVTAHTIDIVAHWIFDAVVVALSSSTISGSFDCFAVVVVSVNNKANNRFERKKHRANTESIGTSASETGIVNNSRCALMALSLFSFMFHVHSKLKTFETQKEKMKSISDQQQFIQKRTQHKKNWKYLLINQFLLHMKNKNESYLHSAQNIVNNIFTETTKDHSLIWIKRVFFCFKFPKLYE